MMDPTHEYIVWLTFSIYGFQKIIPYFPYSEHDFENGWEDVFKV